MEAFETPEIRRVDLCATVLELHAWGTSDPRAFGWYETPDEEILSAAEGAAGDAGGGGRRGADHRDRPAPGGASRAPAAGAVAGGGVGAGAVARGGDAGGADERTDILRWERYESRDSLAAGAGRVMGSSDLLRAAGADRIAGARCADRRVRRCGRCCACGDELERVVNAKRRQHGMSIAPAKRSPKRAARSSCSGRIPIASAGGAGAGPRA